MADHFGTIYICHKESHHDSLDNISSRCINATKLADLKTILSSADFSEFLNETDTDLAHDKFLITYKQYFDGACPYEEIIIKRKKINNTP